MEQSLCQVCTTSISFSVIYTALVQVGDTWRDVSEVQGVHASSSHSRGEGLEFLRMLFDRCDR